MNPENLNSFFSPVSTDVAHQDIDELIALDTLNNTGSMRAADPLWNQYLQYAEKAGDWMVDMFPPSPGVEKGTPKYEQAQENIRSLFGFIPQEKWEIPLIGLGAAGKAGQLGKSGITRMQKAAKKAFGTTDDMEMTGFILDDGAKLNFSKEDYFNTPSKYIVYPHSTRMLHDEIRVIGKYSDDFKDVNYEKFVEDGAVRIDGEYFYVHMANMPSKAQMKEIKKLYEKYEDSGLDKHKKSYRAGRDKQIGTVYGYDDKFKIDFMQPAESGLKGTSRDYWSGSWQAIERDIKMRYGKLTPEDAARQALDELKISLEGKNINPVEAMEGWTTSQIIKYFRDLGKGG